MHQTLTKFNLTKNEEKIYLTLLELGSTLTGELTNKTGIHRRNVYDSIERLIKKGLVGYITKNNYKYFQAINPERFFYLLEKEQEELNQKQKDFRKILPQLLLAQTLAKEKQKVTIYEGKQGLINVLEDVLKTKKENLVFSTVEPELIQNYLKQFHQKRVQAKIKDKLILNQKEIKRANKLNELKYTEVRLMPEGFDSPLVLNIYGNKVGMLIYSEHPIALLIEDKSVATAFKDYFKVMWQMAQRLNQNSKI